MINLDPNTEMKEVLDNLMSALSRKQFVDHLY